MPHPWQKVTTDRLQKYYGKRKIKEKVSKSWAKVKTRTGTKLHIILSHIHILYMQQLRPAKDKQLATATHSRPHTPVHISAIVCKKLARNALTPSRSISFTCAHYMALLWANTKFRHWHYRTHTRQHTTIRAHSEH